MAEAEQAIEDGWEVRSESEVSISGQPNCGNQIYRDCLRLQACSSLQRLHLTDVGITVHNLGAIVTLIIMSRSLEVLDLSYNDIRDDGATQLAVAANRLTKLRVTNGKQHWQSRGSTICSPL